jgi:hypothetical protein
MGKFPYQSLLAALLLLALAFSVHDRSPAQAQDATRLSLQVSCEPNSDQGVTALREDASLSCPAERAKNNR